MESLNLMPMQLAAIRGNREVISFILEQKPSKAFLDTFPEKQLHPVYLAIIYGYVDIAIQLSQNGHALDPKVSSFTLLHLAASEGLLKLVEDLVVHQRYDINEEDKHGLTPLMHYISSPRSLEAPNSTDTALDKLIRLGADVNMTSGPSYTSVRVALLAGRFQMVAKLLDRGYKMKTFPTAYHLHLRQEKILRAWFSKASDHAAQELQLTNKSISCGGISMAKTDCKDIGTLP
ncbi:Serine/threonine-protein phosphatase 6 regulatory ankyrin repeat subunit C-like protein [Cladobotryum mycophilum]|uniref:Serine/threonine-protein phosphatase 6 regulatory ankyrin repeat subunit C-like protein n=1 Tax=Cladobotryum mycophilum TaxID=491253 RepID=A0ABR0S8D2_9HYPO